ncbi:MAG: RNA polymerase sigma factor [Candidatus Pacebacteria bacterium]|nr:RNA polymerase sigma factor [Candidatus Paceibacterota bacterium]
MPENETFLDKKDEELVKLILKDKEDYRYLIQRYEDKLMRYIIRLCGAKREDAEDILQNVFLKVYQNLNDFDTSLKFSSWIYRIAHNETVSFLRKLNSRPKTINSETASFILNAVRADLNMEQEIDKKNLAEKINETVNGLEGKYRDVLVLKYLEDKDYREISDILKKPPGTVATLLRKAKEQLKKEILKHGYFSKDIKNN